MATKQRRKQQGQKEISCGDFRSDCEVTLRAKSEKELLDKCQEHACSAHGKCSDSPEIKEMIRSHIRCV